MAPRSAGRPVRNKMGAEGAVPSSYIERIASDRGPEPAPDPALPSPHEQRQPSGAREKLWRKLSSKRMDDGFDRQRALHHRGQSRASASSGSGPTGSVNVPPPPTGQPRKANMRVWYDKTGEFRTDAAFLGLVPNEHGGRSIRLHKANGSVIAVSADMMSLADIQFLEEVTGCRLREQDAQDVALASDVAVAMYGDRGPSRRLGNMGQSLKNRIGHAVNRGSSRRDRMAAEEEANQREEEVADNLAHQARVRRTRELERQLARAKEQAASARRRSSLRTASRSPSPSTPMDRVSSDGLATQFLAAGIDEEDAEQYARVFQQEKVDPSVLPYLDADAFRTLTLKEGDIIRFRRHLQAHAPPGPKDRPPSVHGFLHGQRVSPTSSGAFTHTQQHIASRSFSAEASESPAQTVQSALALPSAQRGAGTVHAIGTKPDLAPTSPSAPAHASAVLSSPTRVQPVTSPPVSVEVPPRHDLFDQIAATPAAAHPMSFAFGASPAMLPMSWYGPSVDVGRPLAAPAYTPPLGPAPVAMTSLGGVGMVQPVMAGGMQPEASMGGVSGAEGASPKSTMPPRQAQPQGTAGDPTQAAPGPSGDLSPSCVFSQMRSGAFAAPDKYAALRELDSAGSAAAAPDPRWYR